ncbi:MAG: Ig-like domain-containing protein, partial [Clostridia bacterium]|nr:Ig-like domain-containing protein [Clostridia bacterium]
MEQTKKKKWRIRLIVLAVIVGVLMIGVSVDCILAAQYTIRIQSVSPEPVIADGETQCELRVAVTDKKGNPQAGHTVSVRILSGGGNFAQQRNTTDENGEILLSFKPLRASKYNP